MAVTTVQQQQQRRARTGRMLAVLAASAGVFGTAFSQLPGNSKTARPSARRLFLTAATAGMVGAAAAGDAGAAELFAPMPTGTGVTNNPKFQMKMPDTEALLKEKQGNFLGRITWLKGICVETDPEGKTAKGVSDYVIVFDADAPCGEGKAFIHAAGPGKFEPMTAAAGPLVHRYTAETFDETSYVASYSSKVGQCADLPKGGADPLSWEIASRARGGKC